MAVLFRAPHRGCVSPVGLSEIESLHLDASLLWLLSSAKSGVQAPSMAPRLWIRRREELKRKKKMVFFSHKEKGQ